MTHADRTLTDRYVAATLARLPEDQRADVEAQLREAIGDDLDARIDEGMDRAAAERAVLTTMGDPERLAAAYADRSLYLIGPELYLPWKRLTVTLLWIVLPIMAVLIPVGGWLDGDGVWAIIGTTLGGTLTVGVHVVFWVTLVFAVLGRGRLKAADLAEEWTVDQLPTGPDPRIPWSDTIVAVGTIVIVATLIVWQQVWPWGHTDAGEGLPVLNPDLWTFVLPALLALMAVELVAVIARQLRGYWTLRDWWLSVVLNVASAVLVAVPVAQQAWLNRALFAEIGWPDAATDVTLEQVEWITLVVVVAVSLWDIIESYRKARLAR